jgi:hypothetical protein
MTIHGAVILVHAMSLQSMFKSHEHRTALTNSGHRIEYIPKRKFEDLKQLHQLHQVGALEDGEYETARRIASLQSLNLTPQLHQAAESRNYEAGPMRDMPKLACSKENAFSLAGQQLVLPILNDARWTKYVDKLQFKVLCAVHKIPTFETIWVLSELEEFHTIMPLLPNRFVLKSNKASQRNLIIPDKTKKSVPDLMMKMKGWDKPYWNKKDEPQYEFTKTKIFVEEFIDPIPPDIKVIVANGKPTLLWIDEERQTSTGARRTVYAVTADGEGIERLDDCQWGSFRPTGRDPALILELVDKGKIPELLQLSQIFKIDSPLVRLDWYWHKDQFFGSEVTLSPAGFSMECIPESCAQISLGSIPDSAWKGSGVVGGAERKAEREKFWHLRRRGST